MSLIKTDVGQIWPSGTQGAKLGAISVFRSQELKLRETELLARNTETIFTLKAPLPFNSCASASAMVYSQCQG